MKPQSLLTITILSLLSINSALAQSLPHIGIGFSAPNVNGTANVGNPSIGDIIFDTSANAFAGYGGSSVGWLNFGGSTTTFRAPTVQTFAVASTSHYYLPSPTPLYIKVRLVGAGGGGGGSSAIGSANAGAGGPGGQTLFGSSFIVANGGLGGGWKRFHWNRWRRNSF